MKYGGVALDCDQDGDFYRCPNCKIRIVVFKKMSEKELVKIVREALDRIDGYGIEMRDLVERIDGAKTP